MSQSMFNKITEALARARSECSKSSLEVSDQELEWLMEEATGLGKLQRMFREASEPNTGWEDRFCSHVQRRLLGEPTQYILGRASFYGRDFKVDERVLIPRPETELLVEWVVGRANHMDPIRILDIGTGSGCIAISLALEIPESHVTALDISDDALAVARQNASEWGADIVFCRADFLHDPVPEGPFDFVVSNPPYVPTSELATMQPEVAQFEPHLALFAGEDHQLFFRKMAQIAPSILASDGLVVLEGHAHHLHETRSLFTRPLYSDVSIHRDLAGLDRFLTARVDRS